MSAIGSINIASLINWGEPPAWLKWVMQKVGLGGGSVAEAASGGIDGKRAAGGPVRAGGTYLVGERGPELFQPSQSGKIIPNDVFGQISPAPRKTEGAPSGGGVNVHIASQTFQVSGVSDPAAVAREAARLIERDLRDAFAGGHWNGGYRVA